MAYIYRIINDINGKKYIGKTEFDINKRFKEHCNASHKKSVEKRPLYRAMRKYGIEHFHIELIEETEYPDEREMYWIDEEQTYKNGYNATFGGDGKRLLDYDLIIKTYNNLLNLRETAKVCGASVAAIRKILCAYNISIRQSGDIVKEKSHKEVGMYDKDDHSCLIKSFQSVADASKYLIENKITISSNIDGVSAHITQVCNDKRQSAYGYFWKYIN